MIDNTIIESLSDGLKTILSAELAAGNRIRETYKGTFASLTGDEGVIVFLSQEFKTEIRNDIKGIIYLEVNDRHYWKAEYSDRLHNQSLACGFN